MGISIRDSGTTRSTISSTSGQAIVEYILILFVVVGIALGVVYQFNDAFKKWSANYFGEYVACLLETGELPIIDNAPGDSGICSQLFKPFSLADGVRLKSADSTGGGGGSGSDKGGPGSGSGSREVGRNGGSSGSGGGSGSFGGGRGRGGSGRLGDKAAKGKKSGEKDTFTGDTSAGGYGGGYSATNRKLDVGLRQRIDKRFAFETEREAPETRRTASVTKSKSGEDGGIKRAKIRGKKLAGNSTDTEDGAPIGFGNLLRYLIIAAIIIALIVFLGGQALQISKSME